MKFFQLLVDKIHCLDYKKFLTKIKYFYFSKKLRFYTYLFILFSIPFVLAIPIPPYAGIYKIKVTNYQQTEQKSVSINREMQSAGTSFFSKISGISSYNYDVDLCILNRNRPILNNQIVDSKKLVDGSEAGAMQITIEYPESNSVALYAPPLKIMPSCIRLMADISTSTVAYMDNNPIFRDPFPWGPPTYELSENGPIVKIPIYQMSGVDTSDTRVFILPIIFSNKFIYNYVIFFIAWSIIYTHIIKLWLNTKEKYKNV